MRSYVLDKYNLQITHIPKSGCKSIKQFILNVNDIECNNIDLFNNYGYLFNFSNVVKNNNELISVVRNPYSRIVSAYYDKIISTNYNKLHASQNIIKYYKRKDEQRISFEEFIDFIISRNDEINNEHWKSQNHLIGDNNSKIFKIEENEKELIEYLYNKTGKYYTKYIDDKNTIKENIGVYVGDKYYDFFKPYIKNNIQPVVDNFYNTEYKRKIYKYYEKDFLRFGYIKNYQ